MMLSVLVHWILYFFAVFGFYAFTVNYTAWFSSYLFYLVLILPLFSILMMLFPFFALRFHLVLPESIHRGEAAFLRVEPRTVFCPYFTPVYLSVSQTPIHTDVKNVKRYRFMPYPVMHRRAENMAGGSVTIPINTLHTTVIRLEIKRIYIQDFLGLFLFPVSRKRITCNLSGYSVPIPTRDLDIVILPNASAPTKRIPSWNTQNDIPVPTQRPTEQYEIRDYRPGDTLRSVHWKLSVKTDALLVRESVESACRIFAVTVDRPQNPDDADAVYDVLDYVITTLLQREHIQTLLLAWIDESGQTQTEAVRDIRTRADFYMHILSELPPPELPPDAFDLVLKQADRGCHLDAGICAKTAASQAERS